VGALNLRRQSLDRRNLDNVFAENDLAIAATTKGSIMATKAFKNGGEDTYLKLIKKFPLRSIKDDKELALAHAKLDGLLSHEPLDEGEVMYLDALSDLVEHYEEHHVILEQATDTEIIRQLMSAHQLNQTGFAEKIGVTKSVVSEILKGERRLNRKQIDAMARAFGISRDTFEIE
jgi:HTH-type transcriptional regulator / antitoxin HigA